FIENPLGITALADVLSVVVWAAGLLLAVLSLVSVVALVQRFRRSTGEVPRQLRWLATISALTGIFLILTLLTSIGLAPGGSTAVNDFAFLAFFVCVGVGIPAAWAVARLQYPDRE